MDDRRFRTYLSIIVILSFVILFRLIANVNPAYNAVEPLITWFDNQSSKLSSVRVSNNTTTNQAIVLQNEALNKENDKLRQKVGVKRSKKLLPAKVTRRDLLGFRKFVSLNVGHNDGVRSGQAVTYNGFLFGEVEEVFATSALVRTIIDPEFRATVVIANNHGVMKVQWGSLIVDLVPSKLLEGQLITTDGLDGKLSSGLVIGQLDQQISDSSKVFGSYNIILVFNVHEVNIVDVSLDAESLP